MSRTYKLKKYVTVYLNSARETVTYKLTDYGKLGITKDAKITKKEDNKAKIIKQIVSDIKKAQESNEEKMTDRLQTLHDNK